MRKKLVALLLLTISVLSINSNILADTFNESSSQHQYSGGFIQSKASHWTQYRLNSPTLTIGAGIKVKSHPTEIDTGQRLTRIESKYMVSVLDTHKHSWYHFDY
ncbi:MAG: hypothetical protein GX753_02315 [Erysipelothrix sp.]|nr:hypothetical protein [Erysipelothrix sp.]